jgi:hypothetical protein
MLGLRVKAKADESVEFGAISGEDNDDEIANVEVMSVDNSRLFTKEIKVKRKLAKCPFFIVKGEMKNQVKPGRNWSFRNVTEFHVDVVTR